MTTLVTERVYVNAAEAYKGFCTTCCKFTRKHTEPDATGYDCPKCKQNTVMGAEEAMMAGIIEFK